MRVGSAEDPFIQDTTFLPLIETIIRRLDNLPYLVLHTIYVFFDHLCQNWLQQHPGAGYNATDIELAGMSLDSIRAKIQAMYTQQSFIAIIIHLGGTFFDHQISSLLPIFIRTNDGQNLIGLESGMMGLIGTVHLNDYASHC